MPLITCPDCQKQISDAAPACPHCGRPNSRLAAAASRPATVVAKQETSPVTWGCLTMILLVVFVGMISTCADTSSDTPVAPATFNASAVDGPGAPADPPPSPAESLEARVANIRSMKSGDCTPPEKWVRNRLKKNPEWSDDVIATTTCNRISIGMTQDQARAGWGAPEDINRSVYTFGVHEQWVYGSGNYLYFKDGILTSFQN